MVVEFSVRMRTAGSGWLVSRTRTLPGCEVSSRAWTSARRPTYSTCADGK